LPRRTFLHRRLPIFSVEWIWRNRSKVDIVEAAHVDIDLVRIGARHVERMNPAVFAKRVLCRLGVELISCQIILTADKLEALRRHDEVEKSLLHADRTITISDMIKICGDAKAHATAMARHASAALMYQRVAIRK
jgi:hypothetical protein